MADPCGLLARSVSLKTRLCYVPLNDFQQGVKLWREFRAQAQPPTQGHAVVQLADQQNHTLDFTCLLRNSSEYGFCHSHKGLVLISVRHNDTYEVYNPLYKNTVHLPISPPHLPENGDLRILNEAVIINLSDGLPNTPCNFMVFRIRKEGNIRKFAQVCRSANILQWDEFELVYNSDNRLTENRTCNWNIIGSVFLHNTLFCFVGSDSRCIVGIRFGEPATTYSLSLPEDAAGLSNPTLLASQGSLYVAYASKDYLGIWKFDGDLQVEPWVQQRWTTEFLFNGNDEQDGNVPNRNPKATEFLNKINYRVPSPLNMHPQQPIVYIDRDWTISKFHLHNDENVDSTPKLEDEPIFLVNYNYIFSPCFNHFV